MGIEPTSEAWEACNLTQKTLDWRYFCDLSERLNWKIMENGKHAPMLCAPIGTFGHTSNQTAGLVQGFGKVRF